MRQSERFPNLPAPGAADAFLAGAVIGLALLGFVTVEFETGGVSFTIRNFIETKWFALGAAIVAGGLMFVFGRLEAVRPRPGALDLLLLLLLGWMALSLAWSPDPVRGAMAVLYGALLLVLYGGVRVLRRECKRRSKTPSLKRPGNPVAPE
ncbi:MAG: hypothetical protein O2905_04990 [Proteobacteria bacterium]|nr:hypothetical protein [Pseudomonadota bacterium]